MAPASLYARSNGSASSASPPTVSTPSMLIVPQPINAAKMPPTPPGIGQNPPNNGSARKYQCKMCPQLFACNLSYTTPHREISQDGVSRL
nr:zinc finger protein rotund-like [Procambarus clarkii]